MQNRPVPGRSVVATRYGVVATSHPLAAMAGVQMLERGGTAADAAIAANAVLGVVEPMMNGIGGDLFAIISPGPSVELAGLNASGWAPSGLTPDLLAARGCVEMPERGILSVTVPGAVAGWDAIRARFGRLPLATSLAAAIRYADEGFPVSEVTARMWMQHVAAVTADPGARSTYLVDGRAPREGEIYRNPDLAASLRQVATSGRDAFYRGAIADALVRFAGAQDGPLTAADLADFDPEWVTPIQATYRGWMVSELPPNTQGVAALLMLGMMEQFPLGEYGFHSGRTLHTMIEAKKLAFADLIQCVGDPRFGPVPLPSLLTRHYAAARARLIDPERAHGDRAPSDVLTGLPDDAYDARGSTISTDGSLSDPRGRDTVYVAAVDREGMIVSLIQSIYMGFGSGLVAPGTGFALQNRGALFTLHPGHPNTLAGRKRPLHTLIPGFMEKADVRIGFGIIGAWNQAQAHAQFVSAIADFGCSIQEALEAGRFTKRTTGGRDVKVEELVPEATRAELRDRGHVVESIPPRSSGDFGFGQAVMSTAAGVHSGASDPRHDGAAIPQGPDLQEQ